VEKGKNNEDALTRSLKKIPCPSKSVQRKERQKGHQQTSREQGEERLSIRYNEDYTNQARAGKKNAERKAGGATLNWGPPQKNEQDV